MRTIIHDTRYDKGFLKYKTTLLFTLITVVPIILYIGYMVYVINSHGPIDPDSIYAKLSFILLVVAMLVIAFGWSYISKYASSGTQYKYFILTEDGKLYRAHILNFCSLYNIQIRSARMSTFFAVMNNMYKRNASDHRIDDFLQNGDLSKFCQEIRRCTDYEIKGDFIRVKMYEDEEGKGKAYDEYIYSGLDNISKLEMMIQKLM